MLMVVDGLFSCFFFEERVLIRCIDESFAPSDHSFVPLGHSFAPSLGHLYYPRSYYNLRGARPKERERYDRDANPGLLNSQLID